MADDTVHAETVHDDTVRDAAAHDETVRWISDRAHPLALLDPEAPYSDLLPLADLVGDAQVVALGASSRQAHELATASSGVIRQLVEELGFRSVALEAADTSGLGLDEYLRTGAGDPRALLSEARPFLRTEEILDTVRWMREFNRGHPDDQVRFAGTAARPLRKSSGLDALAGIELSMAEDLIEWHERTGDKIVYWGGMVHTAKGDPRTISPSATPTAHRNAGGHLRERFGAGFVSIGLMFQHGRVPYPVPAPPPEFAETVLGDVGLPAYLLDLRGDAPEGVRNWLGAPARTRLIGPHFHAETSADNFMAGGSLAEWFDAILHVREVTSARFLPVKDD
ncbi:MULTISPECIES: erythromycin esterase family protein [unclassified Streptomyces]|uniref:erythromycin esterase family protein n=1 Tax=unclassified Streptomyces TaxID=2593676 RepID=UPI002E8030D2|nr:erythromycin esterase family protein [Streptomyces sp. NBC_00589]WTI39603.1 erythromycin esterase family protein [Streptomyces sp. NBC_00775]WUB26718.1 erythromycin esterase family protein [Streptomyces sp. NBC_00589]